MSGPACAAMDTSTGVARDSGGSAAPAGVTAGVAAAAGVGLDAGSTAVPLSAAGAAAAAGAASGGGAPVTWQNCPSKVCPGGHSLVGGALVGAAAGLPQAVRPRMRDEAPKKASAGRLLTPDVDADSMNLNGSRSLRSRCSR